jgi:RNA polymerase I-specific transcription initiation factor RRN3
MTAAAVTANSYSSTLPKQAPTISVSASMSSKEENECLPDASETTITDAVSVSHPPLHMHPSGALRFVLQKCQLPPRKEFEPVETFVANAVKEQHEQKDDNSLMKSYKGIIDAIRFKNDPVMLQRLLLALRTAGNGSTLHLLASSASKHSRLIHNIVRLNPFELPTTDVGPDQGTEQSVDYALADAQLHLMLALVSANSVFLVPTMTSLWKILTFQITGAPVER